MDTKVIIEVPAEVQERAKTRADLEGTSVEDVLRQWLETYAAGLDESQPAEGADRVTSAPTWEPLFSLLSDTAVDTGIADLADQHDHYLYGKPKHD